MVYRAGLRAVLEEADDIRVVGEAPDCDVALDVVASTEPDVVLLDGDLPGPGGGADVCEQIRDARPDAHVVLLTASEDGVALVASARAGAVGYLLKESPPEHLRAAVREVVGGGSPIDPKIAGSLLAELVALSRAATPAQPWDGLTRRQVEVLRLVAAGLRNREIGARLFISEFTVKNHVRAVLERLGLTSRVEAAAWAVRVGLVGHDDGVGGDGG